MAAIKSTTPYSAVGNGGEVVLAHPAGDEREQRQPEQQVEVGPQHAAVDAVGRVQQVMVVVPVDAEEDEAQDVAEEHRPEAASAASGSPCGTFSSSTMIVMMMAITPSLKDCSRSFSTTRPWRQRYPVRTLRLAGRPRALAHPAPLTARGPDLCPAFREARWAASSARGPGLCVGRVGPAGRTSATAVEGTGARPVMRSARAPAIATQSATPRAGT